MPSVPEEFPIWLVVTLWAVLGLTLLVMAVVSARSVMRNADHVIGPLGDPPKEAPKKDDESGFSDEGREAS